MTYLNSDGRPASMCGNGARAITHFAHLLNLKPSSYILDATSYNFSTDQAVYSSILKENNLVCVKMTEHSAIKKGVLPLKDNQKLSYHFMNTGVPHCLISIENLEHFENVHLLGKEIRNHVEFSPMGANVNFYEIKDEKNVMIRTYERGVEDETLSCGTGITALGILLFQEYNFLSPITIQAKGGKLTVTLKEDLSEIFLEGPVELIYQGNLIN